jgi:hypothetical protein
MPDATHQTDDADASSSDSSDSSLDLEAAFPDEESDDDLPLGQEAELEDTDAPEAPQKKKLKKSRLWETSNESSSLKRFRPHFTLVVCYLSCITLRIPIFVNDLLQCVWR